MDKTVTLPRILSPMKKSTVQYTKPADIEIIQLRRTSADMAASNSAHADGTTSRYREPASVQGGPSSSIRLPGTNLGDRSSVGDGANACVQYCISTQDYDDWSNSTGGRGFSTNVNRRNTTIQLDHWANETSRTKMTFAEILEKSKMGEEKLNVEGQTSRKEGGH
ncbi:hypothetical protein ACMFMF_004814 [Clarireedia jacksonii]